MDRGLERDQWQDVRGFDSERSARGPPCLHTGDELKEKLHDRLPDW